MQTQYQRGRSGEYYIINILEQRGYKCLRSAGSHSPIDILAAKGATVEKNHRLAIQAKKSEKNRMTTDEEQKLMEWANLFNALPVEAFKKNGKWVFRDLFMKDPIEL
jgi:Holliday junction resolvase